METEKRTRAGQQCREQTLRGIQPREPWVTTQRPSGCWGKVPGAGDPQGAACPVRGRGQPREPSYRLLAGAGGHRTGGHSATDPPALHPPAAPGAERLRWQRPTFLAAPVSCGMPQIRRAPEDGSGTARAALAQMGTGAFLLPSSLLLPPSAAPPDPSGSRAAPCRAGPQLPALGRAEDSRNTCPAALLLRNLAGSPIGQHTEPTASEKTFPGSLEISDSDFFCLKREDLPEPFGELLGPSFMDTKEIFAAGGDDANIPAPW